MHRIILVVAFGIASVSFANGIPQNLNQKRDFNDGKQVERDDNVDSRYYSGYNGGYYPSSWPSWSNGGYNNPSSPQDVYYNNGYNSGSYYGNSYNKAGYCPSSGRRRRDAESGPEIVDARYYSNGNYYSGSSSTYYCNNDYDCTGNLKCCYQYGKRQCSYPHYSYHGHTTGGIGIGLWLEMTIRR